jgi:hypothetical protein
MWYQVGTPMEDNFFSGIKCYETSILNPSTISILLLEFFTIICQRTDALSKYRPVKAIKPMVTPSFTKREILVLKCNNGMRVEVFFNM